MIGNKHIKLLLAALVSCFSMNAIRGQELEKYIKIAVENSPGLQSRQFEYHARLEQTNEAGSLPNTTIGGGYFVQEAETRVGPQTAKLSVSQMFPWFGTLKAKKEATLQQAESSRYAIEDTKKELILKVKQQYYNLYLSKESVEVFENRLKILKTYEELALNNVQSGQSSMVDVLRIRMRVNELESQLENLKKELNTNKRIFNVLLNRDTGTDVVITDTLTLDGIEENGSVDDNPKLLQVVAMEKASLAAEKAVVKEKAPSIGLGLDYVFVSERPMAMPDNGKDIVMPMVNFSIPLFSKKFTSKQKQLQLEQKALAFNKAEVKNTLQILYEKALVNAANAKEDYNVQLTNSEQARLAEKVILTTYQTGALDFEQILEIQDLSLKYELDTVKSVVNYHNNKAIIESLTK